MEIYMPLIAVIIGVLTPVIVGINVARREREEQELCLVPLEHRAVKVLDHYRHGARRTLDI
jgi:hypothetical protein